jgi:hypothetical protein
MIYFTSICSNYLPKAMALAESVKRHCSNAIFVVCLVEREAPPEARAFQHFDRILLAKDAGFEHFDQFIFRHSIVEASTAVKAQAMLHLLNLYPNESKFVYLDPDILVYADFIELRRILDTSSIVLAPHLLVPGNIDMEISSMAHGTYNLGFLAIRRSENSQRMLQWWSERLFRFCYDDKARGIFTDQKWIDLVPCFFDAHILKHHGYDFATWSLMGCTLVETADGYTVNGDPLRFIHFSGVDSDIIQRVMRDWMTDVSRPVFAKLHQQYLALLTQHGQATLGKLAWSYGAYQSGEAIARDARISYRDPESWVRFPEPFLASNEAILPAVRRSAGPINPESRAQGLAAKFFSCLRNEGPLKALQKAVHRIKLGLTHG